MNQGVLSLEQFLQKQDILDRAEVHDFLCFGDDYVLRDKRILKEFVCKTCHNQVKEWKLSVYESEESIHQNCNSCRNKSALKSRPLGHGIKSLTDKHRQRIIQLRKEGKMHKEISHECNLTMSTVGAVCREEGL